MRAMLSYVKRNALYSRNIILLVKFHDSAKFYKMLDLKLLISQVYINILCSITMHNLCFGKYSCFKYPYVKLQSFNINNLLHNMEVLDTRFQ